MDVLRQDASDSGVEYCKAKLFLIYCKVEMKHVFNSAFRLNGIKLRTIYGKILFDELNLLFVLAYFNIVKFTNLFIIQ
jgi:hypothetical protein